MGDEWSKAVENLSEQERKNALENLQDIATETESGIIRQILGKEQKPLTDKQQLVFAKYIKPSLVERCGVPSCKNLVPSGEIYCATCSIEYGE